MPEITAVQTSVVERFLRYVTVRHPVRRELDDLSRARAKQLVLLDQLVEELQAIGLKDAVRDEHGYVLATIPATTQEGERAGDRLHRARGHLARGAAAPDVKPIVHRNWQGEDIVLPDDPTRGAARSRTSRRCASRSGNDIITASGTTLLGADNKAGVAEIVAAAEYLVQHPEIPHGAIRIGFTPDEEVGGGTEVLRRRSASAPSAPTPWTARRAGELEIETFSADAMTVTFQGFNTHPGFAKGKMVNSIKIAADFIEPPAEGPALARDHRGARGLRPPLRGGRRRSSRPRSSS